VRVMEVEIVLRVMKVEIMARVNKKMRWFVTVIKLGVPKIKAQNSSELLLRWVERRVLVLSH
jgi:hypothetical protein